MEINFDNLSIKLAIVPQYQFYRYDCSFHYHRSFQWYRNIVLIDNWYVILCFFPLHKNIRWFSVVAKKHSEAHVSRPSVWVVKMGPQMAFLRCVTPRNCGTQTQTNKTQKEHFHSEPKACDVSLSPNRFWNSLKSPNIWRWNWSKPSKEWGPTARHPLTPSEHMIDPNESYLFYAVEQCTAFSNAFSGKDQSNAVPMLQWGG